MGRALSASLLSAHTVVKEALAVKSCGSWPPWAAQAAPTGPLARPRAMSTQKAIARSDALTCRARDTPEHLSVVVLFMLEASIEQSFLPLHPTKCRLLPI